MNLLLHMHPIESRYSCNVTEIKIAVLAFSLSQKLSTSRNPDRNQFKNELMWSRGVGNVVLMKATVSLNSRRTFAGNDESKFIPLARLEC